MSNNNKKERVSCLLFEGGHPINFENKLVQVIGNPVLQAVPIPKPCPYIPMCEYYIMHNECPPVDELIEEYRRRNGRR